MGWIGIFLSTSNVSAIRVIRILRPLRTINSMPGMRMLVHSLLASLPTLFDILILFLFVLIVFGIISTQLFSGLLLKHCYSETTGELLAPINENFCSSTACPAGYICKETVNPVGGVTSFDNVGLSILNIFIIITLEGWTDIMYQVREASNQKVYDLYFCLIVILGTFFVLNLMIAVQFTYLQESLGEDPEAAKKARKAELAKKAKALRQRRKSMRIS